MKSFGETIRELRQAQDLGLREMASRVGISPAYLSRIERNKERPPKPEVIKSLAKHLAADPDVLFRLSAGTDPELSSYLCTQPMALSLLRHIKDLDLTDEEIHSIIRHVSELRRRTAFPAV
jgi:transcriptional regulator with XRE-family HTH domain